MLSGQALAQHAVTEISINNDNIGNLKVSLPEKWQGSSGKDELTGASILEIESRKEKFTLRLEFSYIDLGSRSNDVSLDEYIQNRLSSYLNYSLPELTGSTVDFDVRRFGPDGHGQYARLATQGRDRGKYTYLSHGARIVGQAIVVFTLESNDADESVLARTLAAVSTVRLDAEIASFVGSYTCRTEHRVGFRGRNAVWIPDIVDVVDQIFIVRTVSEGDRFAEKTSWVFVEAGRMRANSWCEEAAVEKGLFICHGASDEAFRMDTGTLRFLYSQMEGYYDVAEDEILAKDQATPFMDIGTCKRTER
ncbi:MAG: hypothetical protein OEV63_04445 [Gammaproteobacteria bacterium]|nr:hypothetical protein [Gammaproteobacteria bacterium]